MAMQVAAMQNLAVKESHMKQRVVIVNLLHALIRDDRVSHGVTPFEDGASLVRYQGKLGTSVHLCLEIVQPQ